MRIGSVVALGTPPGEREEQEIGDRSRRSPECEE